MQENTYNGWKNWHTWNVNLWIENDEGLYRLRNEYAERPWTAEMVRSFCSEYIPNGTPDFDSPTDWALVDFDEIAESWNEE